MAPKKKGALRRPSFNRLRGAYSKRSTPEIENVSTLSEKSKEASIWKRLNTMPAPKLQWISVEQGKPVTYDEDPDTSGWTRLRVDLMRALPIEDQL